MNSLLSKKELARIEALYQYRILDTSPEEEFDDLAFLAAQVCQTPIALINLIDINRQWFKAKVGLDVEEMPRSMGFCPLCIEQNDILIIPDTLADERFANSPVVQSYPFARFYAGVPLITYQGHDIGTLCVVDTEPREISEKQIKSLQAISRQVIKQLEIKRNLSELVDIKKEYQQAQVALRDSQGIINSFFESAPMMMGIIEIVDDDILHISGNAAAAELFEMTPEEMGNRLLSEMNLPQQYLQVWVQRYLENSNENLPLTFEDSYDKPTEKIWLKITVSPIPCDNKRQRFAYFVEDITEPKRVESERLQLLVNEQAARNRITNIFESITDGFVALDRQWCFTYVNQQAELLLQRTRKQLLGKSIWEEFPESLLSRFYEEYHHALSAQVSVEFEEFYAPLNIWFSVHAYPSKEGLSIYFQDITERKNYEENLRWKEALLRSMNSVSPLAFYVVDHTTENILFANERFRELWGIEELKEVMERNILKHADVMEACQKSMGIIPFDTCLPESTEKCICEDEILLPDGRTIRRFSRQILNDGLDFGRLYILEDITARKQVEQKIREQAALLDLTTDAIVLRDLYNNILLWNKSAEKLYGWKEEEVIGKNANRLLKTEFKHSEEILNTVLEKGIWRGELKKISKFGKEIIVDSCWTLVKDENFKPKSIMVVDTDITQKKQLETQFLRDQRMESIGTLASGIAHDLNNVLSPILMSAQLLKLKSQDESMTEMLSIVEKNAKRGANLVKQVLSYARGIEGDRTLLQMKHLILEMQQIIDQTFPKSIRTEIDIQPDLWDVYGDNTQIHQVLMNLCLNARDAILEDGTLRISVENIFIDENYAQMNLEAKVGSYVLLKVEDTGIGIPNDLLGRIFEPFFTTKEFGQGTGLGLSTVMGIIKGHGGFISVSSRVGQETSFHVYLPASNVSLEQLVEDIAATPSGCGELILVVDDEPAIREITKNSLEHHNYQVITASDGIEAVAIYAQYKNKISAAIIDMMMPNMDGATTISTLRKMNPQVRIVAVSGLMNSENLPGKNTDNAVTFLQKPYTTQALLQKLHKVLPQN
ncbi:MAG: PAS domain S-box protein [Mastigocoleus sp. MO_167.B18]|nr:PAS domain S-box protein [Mastigocoleus sp. MO_167.B18]